MDICFGGALINNNSLKDRNKAGKYWFLTYYSKWLLTSKNNVESILCGLPSISNFVYQIERDENKKLYVNIAVELKLALTKPVIYLLFNFRTGLTIRYIKDIESAREYCSRTYCRLPNTELVSYTIKKGVPISNVRIKREPVSGTDTTETTSSKEDSEVGSEDEEVKVFVARDKRNKKESRKKRREKRREREKRRLERKDKEEKERKERIIKEKEENRVNKDKR